MQKSPESLNIPDIPMQDDQWRVAAMTAPDDPRSEDGRHGSTRNRIFGSLALVVLADILFWGQGLGLSFAIFAFGVFAFATADLGGQRATWRSLGARGWIIASKYASTGSRAFSDI